MIYSIYPKTSISAIPSNVGVYLVRPIKLDKLSTILRKTKPKKIFLSSSCNKRLSRKTKNFLKKKRIELVKEERRGRAIELDLKKIVELTELRKDEKSFRKIQELTGVPKSTVHYLFRYADRNKVRKGKQIVYLK